jgi:hypothetical protein
VRKRRPQILLPAHLCTKAALRAHPSTFLQGLRSEEVASCSENAAGRDCSLGAVELLSERHSESERNSTLTDNGPAVLVVIALQPLTAQHPRTSSVAACIFSPPSANTLPTLQPWFH